MKKYKKSALVNLSEKNQIKIIPINKPSLDDEEIQVFELKIQDRYNNNVKFSKELYETIKEVSVSIDTKKASITVNEVVEKNKLLKLMNEG